MKRLPRWRPQLAVLVGIWVIGGLGIAAPAEYTDPVRAAVADALHPGRTLALKIAGHVHSAWSRFRAPEPDGELDALRTELAVLRAKAQHQQAEQVELIRQVSAEAVEDGPLSTQGSSPLLTTDIVPAVILGRQPDVLRTRFARFLDRGASAQVTVDNLVLAAGPLMDQGTDAGVEENQPVISGSVVVGNIGQAGHWTSTLRLVTDPEYRANVQLVRDSPAGPVLGPTGVLRGNGGPNCTMEFVPNQAAVSVGDYVYSRQQDLEPAVPLYFGRVVAVDLPPGADDWTIEVEPAFDADSLTNVRILTVSLNPQRIGDDIPPTGPAESTGSAATRFAPVNSGPPSSADQIAR